MLTKILIANRGEIACRVAATARRLGVRTVAVFSDADAQAQHVLACDEAVALGGLAAKDSYLRWELILGAARRTGAQAIHPGYGFLSENADFAQACVDAGIIFIGPPPAAIRSMGSKAAAKALMEKAGVPLVPGYHGHDNNPELLEQHAARIGYPVLIKASAGGGGRGMRRVDKAEDFAAALSSCQREAKASFGDDHVLVERYVTRPRHIEIQVFCDSHGHAVYLFERDCSVQRRHQKVLEEAPAPGLSAQRRAEMGAAAVAAARAVGYVGAGTVEFIAEPTPDGDLRFYFMEMNTRLQVEHPVTEAITGHDLVEWQLRVAQGEPLPVTQDQLAIRGHAIEARICAENPDANFRPATGSLKVARWPQHVAFERSDDLARVDTGFVEGDAISPHYDSMIAKLIVWGPDRQQALARLDAALRDTHIIGLQTNVAFLRHVVRSSAFSTADLDTALIERERAVLFEQEGLPLAVAIAGLIALEQSLAAKLHDADPWSRRDGWRLHGAARRGWLVETNGQQHTAGLLTQHGGVNLLELQGRKQVLMTRPLAADEFEVGLDGERYRLKVYATADGVAVYGGQGHAILRLVDPVARAGDASGATGGLVAPMPGKVVSYLAKPGDKVQQGQALAVMEAMKMEHTLHAPHDGVVAEWHYAVGDQVAEGGALLRLEKAA
jgi:3-methylcrotonyl-CoA carboxylase alpha subunit